MNKLLILVVLLIAGCGSRYPSDEVFLEKYKDITIWNTTKREARALLGKPNVYNSDSGLRGWKTQDVDGDFHVYYLTFGGGGFSREQLAGRSDESIVKRKRQVDGFLNSPYYGELEEWIDVPRGQR